MTLKEEWICREILCPKCNRRWFVDVVGSDKYSCVTKIEKVKCAYPGCEHEFKTKYPSPKIGLLRGGLLDSEDNCDRESELRKWYSFLKGLVGGIDCDEGWIGLIEKLCADIDTELIKYPELRKGFTVTRIKSKLAGLRFYYCGGNKKIKNLIDKACDKSYTICEFCGVYGELYESEMGWLSTLCGKCAKKNKLKLVKRKNKKSAVGKRNVIK